MYMPELSEEFLKAPAFCVRYETEIDHALDHRKRGEKGITLLPYDTVSPITPVLIASAIPAPSC
jgi:hypothetical protein